MEIAHSKIGASSCNRWWNCPGSLALIDTCPPQETSKFAAEGTAAHWVAEQCLLSWLDDEVSDMNPNQYVGEKLENGVTVNQEMADYVLGYMNMIYHDMKPMLSDKVKIKDLLQVEAKFNLKWIHEDMFGTCDAIVAQPFGILRVYDLKYGQGVAVDVKENKQAMFYGLGGAQQGDFNEIELIIHQPRAPHKDGATRRWKLTPMKLTNFGIELKAKALKTFDRGAKRVAGTWCKFCPALNICDAASNKVMEVAKTDFTPAKKLMDPAAMDHKMLKNVLDFTPFMDDWLKAVTAHAQALAESGEKIPGYKLVRKRSNRKWIDEKATADQLDLLYGEDCFIKKLKPLGQLEKIATKEEINELCYKPEAGSVLVKEDDSREAVNPSAIEDFS